MAGPPDVDASRGSFIWFEKSYQPPRTELLGAAATLSEPRPLWDRGSCCIHARVAKLVDAPG